MTPPTSNTHTYLPYTSPACVGERGPQRLRPAVPGLQERVSRGGGVPHLEVSTNHHYSARDVGIHHYFVVSRCNAPIEQKGLFEVGGHRV